MILSKVAQVSAQYNQTRLFPKGRRRKTFSYVGWYVDEIGEGGLNGFFVEEWLARIIHDGSSRNR